MKRILLGIVMVAMAVGVYGQAWEELSKHSILPYVPEDNAFENYGKAVAMDGNYAIIGVPGYDGSKGCAYILYNNGTDWETVTRLTASDGKVNDKFGKSVAISGTTVIVGADEDKEKGANSGSAYVFSYDGSSWSQTTKLTASDGSVGNRFGYSVAISGTTVIVGAIFGRNDGVSCGSAYIFDGANNWAETKLTPSEGETADYFGCSVAISGTTAIVGAPFDDDMGYSSGAAYIFDGANDWSETKLTASDGTASDNFGYSVAISGNTVVIGASGDNNNIGSAYVFDGANAWEETKLTASDGEYFERFGFSVSICGTTVVVGAYYNDNTAINCGAVYIFDGANSWTETKIIASDGTEDAWFGYSVAICGTSMIIGAHQDGEVGLESGSVYVFDGSGGWTSFMPEKQKLLPLLPPSPAYNINYGYYGQAVAIDGNYAIVGAPGYKSHQGCAYILHYNGAKWETVTRLTASDGIVEDRFGSSVSISGTTAIVAGGGSAYIFSYDGSSWSQETILTPSDGYSTSVSISGTTAIVGSGEHNAAYIFDGASAWTETKLTTDDETANSFGRSVAISGTTVIVGDDWANGVSANSGAAYIFRWDGNTWLQITKLTASDGATYDWFGNSVAISGTTVVVGAPYGNNNSGLAYIFDGANAWAETKLISSLGPSYAFGCSVGISGTTAIVGAYYGEVVGTTTGFAHVFDGTNSWTETKIIPSDDLLPNYFGYSVGISGTSAIVGAPRDNGKGNVSGSAYFYNAPICYKWTGAANNTLWTDANNWDGNTLPDGNHPVQIPTGCTYYPELNADFNYGNAIYIKPNASLTVNAGYSLDLGTSGISNEAGGAGLVLKADATGHGQLLLPTDHEAVAATVQNHFPQNKWKSFGFGVHNFTKNDVLPEDVTNWYVQEFVEGRTITGENIDYEENWGYLESGTSSTDAVNGLQGYMGYANEAIQMISTTGELRSDDVTFTLSYTEGSGEGWNLLANPYPTKLDLDYGWNFGGSIGTARYKCREGQYYAAVSANSGDFDVIEPGEAFFVKAENANDLSFSLNASTARVLEKPSIDKKSENESLIVNIANTVNSDHFTVTLHTAATEGFDLRYDAYKMFGDADRPYIYQKAGSKKLSINTIGSFGEETVLPFAVVFPSAGAYSLSFSTTEFNGQKLWVRNLATGTEQAVDNITLTAAEAGEQSFELFMNKKALDTSEIAQQKGSIYSNGEYLFVEIGNATSSQLVVYGMQGQLIKSEVLTSSFNKIGLPSGAYVIKLSTKSETKTKRIVIR